MDLVDVLAAVLQYLDDEVGTSIVIRGELPPHVEEHNTADGTFLWGRDYPSIPEKLRQPLLAMPHILQFGRAVGHCRTASGANAEPLALARYASEMLPH